MIQNRAKEQQDEEAKMEGQQVHWWKWSTLSLSLSLGLSIFSTALAHLLPPDCLCILSSGPAWIYRISSTTMDCGGYTDRLSMQHVRSRTLMFFLVQGTGDYSTGTSRASRANDQYYWLDIIIKQLHDCVLQKTCTVPVSVQHSKPPGEASS
jgi:hypothetical protein